MGLKREYTKSGVGKMNGGPKGWKCPCCNPYNCHPRNMKALAHRRLRRVSKVRLQAALLVMEDPQVEDNAYEMDRYYRELGDQVQQDTWREMDAYESATGIKFVCEAHYHHEMAYLEWKGERELEAEMRAA